MKSKVPLSVVYWINGNCPNPGTVVTFMVSVVPRIFRVVTTALGVPLIAGSVSFESARVRLSMGVPATPIVLVKAAMFKVPPEILMLAVPSALAFLMFPEQIISALLLVKPPVAPPELAD